MSGERVLRRPVRATVVLRYLGELAIALGLTTAVPALGALLLREPRAAFTFACTGGVLLAVGWLARRTREPGGLERNEALVVTAAAFIAGALVLSIPVALQGIPWLDALFESVSGVTTTGLSTLGSIETRSRSFLLARAWMQWVGGLGIVALSVALVLGPGLAARRLGAPGPERADVAGGMRAHARRVLLIYAAVTGLGVALLLVLGAGPFDAVVHAMAGVSTGGFAPRDRSLAELGRPLQVGILGLSILCAVSLPLLGRLGRGRWRELRDDPEVRALAVFTAAGAGLLLLAGPGAPRPGAPRPADLALLAVSAQSTAGFSTTTVEDLPAVSRGVLIGAMMTGGSRGSTAGGMKLLRLLAVLRLVRWLVARTRLPPHAVSAPTLGGERLERDELLRAAAWILLFLAVLATSWLPFLAYGHDPLDSLFEVASALGTVGLSTGIAGPGLEPALKGVLCLDMLLGRLEVFAVLVALSPLTWIGRRSP